MKIESGFTGERLVVLPQPMLDRIADNPLTGDLHIHSMGHISQAMYHSVSHPAGCPDYIFLYCTWGRGEITLPGRTFPLADNQYIVLPAGVPLAYAADNADPWSLYWIRFGGAKGAIFARGMDSPQTLLPSVYSRIEERIAMFEDIYSILCGGYTIEKLSYANLVLGHFLGLFLYTDLFREPAPAVKRAEGMVGRVTHFMNENIEKRLTLREIASYAGYSESYFYRRFVAETGYAPIDYFLHMKINKASVYLLKTTMSVSQIAGKLGFNSANYFSRTFRSVVGISASEFRRQNFRL